MCVDGWVCGCACVCACVCGADKQSDSACNVLHPCGYSHAYAKPGTPTFDNTLDAERQEKKHDSELQAARKKMQPKSMQLLPSLFGGGRAAGAVGRGKDGKEERGPGLVSPSMDEAGMDSDELMRSVGHDEILFRFEKVLYSREKVRACVCVCKTIKTTMPALDAHNHAQTCCVRVEHFVHVVAGAADPVPRAQGSVAGRECSCGESLRGCRFLPYACPANPS